MRDELLEMLFALVKDSFRSFNGGYYYECVRCLHQGKTRKGIIHTKTCLTGRTLAAIERAELDIWEETDGRH